MHGDNDGRLSIGSPYCCEQFATSGVHPRKSRITVPALQFRYLLHIALSFGAVIGIARADEEKPAEDDHQEPFAVRLVDESGKPVVGAEAGLLAAWGDMNLVNTGWEYLSGSDLKSVNAKSDAEGVVRFAGDRRMLARFGLVARHSERKLVAADDLDADSKVDLFTVVMKPHCHVRGKLTCRQAESRARPKSAPQIKLGTGVEVFKGRKIVVEYWSKEPSFELYLPAGDYTLKASDEQAWTKPVVTTFSIKPRQQTLNLEPIDRKLAVLKLLEGEPAPELIGVGAWKNSKPLKIADLKGQVVLLEFFGHWCAPCVYRMPKIMELYDTYHERGLAIVGIHVDLGDDEPTKVDTVEVLDGLLAGSRKDLWKGRDIPFPVALVSKRHVQLGEEIQETSPDTPTTKYGITHYPTQVLIDREGRVVCEFHLNDENILLLEKLLSKR